jgi:hypothetical protein
MGSMSDDMLIAFVRARLDDDELVAKRAGGAPWCHIALPSRLPWRPWSRWRSGVRAAGGEVVARASSLHAGHIAAHSPARIQHEVAAKRRILDEIQDGRLSEEVAELLAQSYDDHPDYRREWAP